jgi:hypothetical protein
VINLAQGAIDQLSNHMEKLNQKTVAHLQDHISSLVNSPVRLTITDNTHSMISIRLSKGVYNIRLHHMFLAADPGILSAMADFIKNRSKKPPPALRDFVAANSSKIRRSIPGSRRAVLRQKGRFFDLKDLFDEVNSEYFENEIDCLITWGANRRVRKQNSIKLGSYSERSRTIRVNPVLDRSYVRNYVIKGIIYHEMLHHYLGVETRNGRKIAHSKTFRRLESRYRHHRKLQAWKEKNLNRLLGRQ